MGIFDTLLKKKSAFQNTRNARENIPVLGRQSEETDDVIDDELPSVNRNKGRSKFVDMLGFATLLGAGLMMIYFINTDSKEKIEQKPKRMEIANRLPPLEMPNLPPPERPAPIEVNGPSRNADSKQVIPLQSVNSQGNQPVQPSWSDRKMSSGILVGETTQPAGIMQVAQQDNRQPDVDKQDVPSPLALKLKPTVSPGVSANLLPDRNYLITKGTALDCALETALDSTVPGLTTCRLTRDVYSDNGHVVLLDRGSQLVGEYQGGLTAGQARIFVLWTRAKTPNGVIVALDSPGTDALGRSGHAGWVDTHFFERFGAAILMSLVKDGISLAKDNSNTSVTIGGGGSDQLATEILKNTVNIPPTLYINQGEHIQIMVARDLDFSTVYGLELKE